MLPVRVMSKFEIESDINIVSSEVTFTTSYGGEECEHEEIVGSIAKRRLALEFILGDISSCIDYLSLVKEYEGLVISKPIYEAFVIKYGKCFASGKERGLSLKAKSYFPHDSDSLKIHSNIIKTRNKYIAHSDSEIFEQGRVLLAKSGNESEVFTPVINYSHPVEHSLEKEIEHCIYLRIKVAQEIGESEIRIKA